MKNDDPLYDVLDYILNRASSVELEVIAEALKRRSGDKRETGGFNPRSMAEGMAQNIQKQLGGILDVHQIARRIVADIVRQKEPGISDDKVEVLLNAWLPGKNRSEAPAGGNRVPLDTLIERIAQYLAAERGALSPDDQRSMPEGWKTSYWDSFPAPVRALLRELLENRITETSFWEKLIPVLQQ